jgi:hypothetical protein
MAIFKEEVGLSYALRVGPAYALSTIRHYSQTKFISCRCSSFAVSRRKWWPKKWHNCGSVPRCAKRTVRNRNTWLS